MSDNQDIRRADRRGTGERRNQDPDPRPVAIRIVVQAADVGIVEQEVVGIPRDAARVGHELTHIQRRADRREDEILEMDEVHGRVEVGDRVDAVQAGEHEIVGAVASRQRIGPRAAADRVVPVAAVDDIVAPIATEYVIARAAVDRVGEARTDDALEVAVGVGTDPGAVTS